MRTLDTYLPSFIPLKKRILLLIILITCASGCLPYQAYRYMIPDQKDLQRFKHAEVRHADVCYEFQKRSPNKSLYITNWTHQVPLIKSPLEDFLTEHSANHFLVIKNDSIVFEYTNKRLTAYEPSPAFSVAKTFTSAAVGMALQEGCIGSINDLVKNYLPELNYHKNFDCLTINHLLNQSSGLKMNVDNISDAYYGKMEDILQELRFTSVPGEKLEYININTVLVGFIIERATGRKLHDYFSEKIWSRIGTCDSTVWAYDHKTDHIRSFCCIGASSRDYAKFGKLYLDKGKWNNVQVLDSNWVISSTTPINALGEEVGYNNYWFIGEEEVGDYMSVGMFRQQIYINPKEQVIIISLMKFNMDNLSLRWWQVLRQIAKQA